MNKNLIDFLETIDVFKMHPFLLMKKKRYISTNIS